MSGIFVCYSRVDSLVTEQLARLLRKAFDHVWYDDNLHGGEEWWAEIRKEIAGCTHFIFLMSDDSVESEWCCKELEEARGLERHIIPVLVRGRTTIPDVVQHIQVIDMSLGIMVENLNQLYATIIRYNPPGPMRSLNRTDRKALERLWLFINGPYIEVLCEQVQTGKIDWEQYTSHVSKYLDLRAKARDRLANPLLEEAFEAFDDALIRLDGQIGWTLELREVNGRSLMSEPTNATQDSYWFEKYSRLVKRATDVWMQHVQLVEHIRAVLPDFDVLKDY